jgi:hypothetical protein
VLSSFDSLLIRTATRSIALDWCCSTTPVLTKSLIHALCSQTLLFLFPTPSPPPASIDSVLASLALINRFNVHGTIYLGDEEHIAPVEQAIRDLSSGLQMVKDEQAYLVVRERIHRNSMSFLSSPLHSTSPGTRLDRLLTQRS